MCYDSHLTNEETVLGYVDQPNGYLIQVENQDLRSSRFEGLPCFCACAEPAL